MYKILLYPTKMNLIFSGILGQFDKNFGFICKDIKMLCFEKKMGKKKRPDSRSFLGELDA